MSADDVSAAGVAASAFPLGADSAGVEVVVAEPDEGEVVAEVVVVAERGVVVGEEVKVVVEEVVEVVVEGAVEGEGEEVEIAVLVVVVDEEEESFLLCGLSASGEV